MRGETLALFLAVLSSSSIYGIIALATLLAYARTWGQPTATQPRLGISAQSVGAAAVIRDASSGTTRHRRPGGRSSPSWTGRRQHSSGSLHKSAARAVQGKPRGAGVRWTPSTTSLPRRGDSPPPTRRHHRHAATEAGGKRPPVPPAQRTHSANERTALLADDEQARVRMLGRPQDGSGTGSDEMLLGASAFSPTDTSPLLDAAGGAADVGDTGYGDAPSANPRGGTDAGDAAVHGGAGGAGPGTGAPGLARSGGGSGSGNGSGPLVTQLASVLAQAHADAQLALARGAGAGAGGADGRSLSSDARRPPALQRVPSATSLASQQSYMSMARPRTFTAPELQAAELRAMKQTQGWVLEAVTYVVMLGVVVSQAVLLGNLVVTGALVLKEGDAQRWFTVQRIALLVAWVANFLVIVVEDCKRVPRGGPTLSWWPVAWAVDLWFLLQHGWRGFSGTPPTTPELEPLCRTCNTLLPLSFAFNSLAVLLCIVYLCRQYNTSDADVYRDALARMDLPHDTRWRRLMRLLGRDRVLVATAILGALLESGVVLLFNILWGRLIDHIESGDRQALNQMSEALAVAALGIGVAVFAEGWCSIVAGARLVLRLQSIAFASLMEEHDQAYIDTQGPDTLATIINDAAPGLKTGMTVSVAQAIEGSVTCVVVISYLAFVSWRLTLIALAGAAVPLMVSAVGGRAVRTRAQAAEVVLEEQEDLALHYMRHSLTLRSCGNESAATATYKGASVRSYGVAKTAATAASALNGFNSGILYGVFVFVFWVGGNMSIDGDIHVGFLVSCALLAFQLIDGIGRVAGAVPAVLTAVDTAKSVLQVLAPQHGARQDDADSPPGRRQSVRGIVGHLKLIDVRFSYPTLPDAEVLSGVNLLLQPGARVALVGERGCGKSTLLMLLQGLYRATRGRVMVDGQDITWLNQKWLRSQVGLAPEVRAASPVPPGLHGGILTACAVAWSSFCVHVCTCHSALHSCVALSRATSGWVCRAGKRHRWRSRRRLAWCWRTSGSWRCHWATRRPSTRTTKSWRTSRCSRARAPSPGAAPPCRPRTCCRPPLPPP